MHAIKFFVITLVSICLAACLGGGGSTSSTSSTSSPTTTTTTTTTTVTPSTSISGIAASGAPIPSGVGFALDAATGTQIPFTTDATGSYSVNLTNPATGALYAGPFLLKVSGVTGSGKQVNLFSIAPSGSAGGTVNVTPLSKLIVAYASGQTPGGLLTACTTTPSSCVALLNSVLANVATATTNIVNSLPASVLTSFGVTAASFNPISTTFSANHTGVDALLDAITVTFPTTTGSASITLSGATPITLLTIPVAVASTTIPPSTVTAPTIGTAPTAVAVTQAANLAPALGEISTFWSNLATLVATSLPTSTQLSPYLDSSFLVNGMNKSTFITQTLAGNTFQVGVPFNTNAGLSPYARNPASTNVTYDANNCVTAIWVSVGPRGSENNWLMKDVIPPSNAAGVCTGGTWTWAGNSSNYYIELVGLYQKYTSTVGGTPSYTATFQFSTDTSQTTGAGVAVSPAPTHFATATISGPGLATFGNKTAATGSVTIIAPPVPTPPAVLQTQLSINDPYYGTSAQGSSTLSNCSNVISGVAGNFGATPTTNTPCFNSLAIGLFTIQFYDAANTLLDTQQQYISAAISTSSVSTSWYPTITSVTPSSTSIVTGTSITTTWTLPPTATSDYQSVSLTDSTGTLIYTIDAGVSPVTALTKTYIVPTLTTTPVSGNSGILTEVAGYKIGTGVGF